MENAKVNVIITLEHYEQLSKIAQGLEEKKNILMYAYSQQVYLIDEKETNDYFLMKIEDLKEKLRLAEEKVKLLEKHKTWF